MKRFKNWPAWQWIFYREWLLYLVIAGTVLLCIDVSKVQEAIKIRQLSDISAAIDVPQLYAFSKGEIPAESVNWKILTNYFNLILKLFPLQEDAQLFLGYCLYYGFHQENDALLHLQHSANNMPSFFWNLYDTGIMFFKKGEVERAVPYFEMALLLHTDKAFYNVLNSVLYRQLFAGTPVQNEELVAGMNNARVNLFLLTGAAYYFLQDYKMAEEFIQRGVSEPNIPDREPFYYYEGSIMMAEGNYAEAMKFFDLAIKAHSKNYWVYLYSAEILKKAGKLKEAKKIYSMMHALNLKENTDIFPYPDYLRLRLF